MVQIRVGGGGVPGKIFLSLFFSAFLAVGLWLTFLVGHGLVRAAATWTWSEADCLILASAVEEHPDASDASEAYRFNVSYRWALDGKELEGKVYRLGYSGSSDVAETQRLADAYPAWTHVRCWVDPRHPSSAVLRRSNLWASFTILFPLVFVAVGGGGIVGIWWSGSLAGWFSGRRRRARERRAEARAEAWAASHPGSAPAPAVPAPSPRLAVFGGGAAGSRAGDGAVVPEAAPLSGRSGGTAGAAGCLVGFFAIFLLAGAGFSLFFIGPALRVVAAQTWPATPCEILHSEVRAHSGDDGSTFSVEVLYRYTVDGKEYKSSRYQFLGGSSSGYDAKAAAVERLPAGSRAVCYVNPKDPHDAVLARSLSTEYLISAVPLVFMFVGAGGIAWVLTSARRARTSRRQAARWLPADAAVAAGAGPAAVTPGTASPAGPGGPVTLHPKVSPLGKLFTLLFVAAFWNGITGVFVWKMVEGWRSGSGDGCLTAFLVPFELIGLALLLAVPYQFLALFNPRPVLTLGRAGLPLGAATELAWRFRGLPGRIRRLRLLVEGREEATYRRGTTTSTDKETFVRIALADTDQKEAIRSGTASLTLPADSMHSFDASHNKVIWTLKVEGEIRFWPDVCEEYPLTVLPREDGGGELAT